MLRRTTLSVKQMDSVGFSRDLLEKNIRTFDNIPLSAEQQSVMSHDIAAVGKLRERLEIYFNVVTEFERKSKAIKQFRSDTKCWFNQHRNTFC